MAGKENEAVAGLDIGSSRIVAALQGLSGGGVFYGDTLTSGYRKGYISDIPLLAASIKNAVESAEEISGLKTTKTVVGISGHTVEFSVKKAGNLIGRNRRIAMQDVERVKRLLLVSEMPPGRRVVQSIPLSYYLDGVPDAGNPVGMVCSRLEIESLIITADNYLVDQVIQAVNQAGLSISDMIPSTLACATAVLTDAETKLGVALVDIGSSCTGVLVCNYGRPVGFEVIPVGSEHVTSDLAICLRTTLEGAEQVKRDMGLPCGQLPDSSCTLTVPRMSGAGSNQASVKTASRITEARVGEMLDLIGAAITRMTGNLEVTGGMVVTGGGSRLKGLGEYMESYLKAKVRIAPGFPGTLEVSGEDSPCVNGAAGLLKSFVPESAIGNGRETQQPGTGLWSRIRSRFGGS